MTRDTSYFFLFPSETKSGLQKTPEYFLRIRVIHILHIVFHSPRSLLPQGFAGFSYRGVESPQSKVALSRRDEKS